MLNREIDTDQKAELPEMDGELVVITEFLYERGQSYATNANAHSDGISKIRLTLYPEHRKAIQDAGYQLSGDVHIPVTMTADRKISAVQMPDGKTWVEVEPNHYETMAKAPAPILVPKPAIEDEPRPCPELALSGQATLYRKMALVMGKIKRIPKSGHNDHFNYDYATESDIADTVRIALSEVGLAFFSEILDYRREGTTITKKDQRGQEYTKIAYTTYLKLLFTFACTETGATINKVWFSEADDDQDKGISKAVTLAQKYFLKSTFVISTGDLADDPDSGVSGKAPRPQKQQQGRAPSPKSSPVPSGTKVANGGQPKPAAPPVGWQFTDNTVTDLMFETKDWSQSRPERMNTINAMRTEGAFEGCANLEAAVGLLKARLEAHRKTDLDALPDEPDGAK